MLSAHSLRAESSCTDDLIRADNTAACIGCMGNLLSHLMLVLSQSIYSMGVIF